MNLTRTMSSYLNLAQRYLPVATTTPSYSSIENIAQALPPLPLIIFESHLDDPRPDMDFLLAATPEQLLHQLPSGQYVKEWAAVQELCQSWQKLPKSDPFRQGVNWVWLEFDTSVNNKNNENPAIYFVEGFINFNREMAGKTEITDVLEKLLKRNPSLAMQKQFTQIFKALPPNARLFALGNMSGRDLTAVRVSLANLPPSFLVQYLDHIAWPGNLSEVESLIMSYTPYFDHLSLDLDVGEKIGPKIGIELYMKSRHAKAPWQSLFDQLVIRGVCLPSKRDQLLTWPGFSNAFTDADIWPEQLNIPETQGHYIFIRHFNHIKLTIETQKPVKAKAYIVQRRLHTKQRPLKIVHGYVQ